MASTNPVCLAEDNTYDAFISYSSADYTLVETIQAGLEAKGIHTFVAASAIEAGTPIIDGIVHGIHMSRKGLFLVTPKAMQSSWFAFETILALERSQQLGRIGAVILLHGVTEEQLPQFALFAVMPRYTLSLDTAGNWSPEQIDEIIDAIKEEKSIDYELPVGNVAHAQAWSHYFGFHNIVHARLEDKIKESLWYKENPAHMPIVVYELLPKSCRTPFTIAAEGITRVGALSPIIVNRAGNKTRPYGLSVYCIEDNGKKYYCIAQYPNVISAIQKMESSPLIEMDEQRKALELARFFYTINAILHHSDSEKCHKQSRVLWFDDEVENPKDILLKAIKSDVERTSLAPLVKPPALDTAVETDYDAAVVYSVLDSEDKKRKDEIEDYLKTKNVKVFPDLHKDAKRTLFYQLGEAAKRCRWLILILTKNALKDAVLNMQAMALLEECVRKSKLRILPIVDDLVDSCVPDMLRWVTYIDMRTTGYKERIYNALKGEEIPFALDAAHIPAGNLGYGLAWGYLVNYLKTVLSQFGSYLQKVFELQGEVSVCAEKLYLLIPSSCKCTGLVSDRWPYVDHYSSFARIDDNLGGANIIKSLDIYCITQEDSDSSTKHYFIGQYPAPVLCLWEMNECRIAGINEEAMRREKDRFCETFNSLLKGAVGEGLHTKCKLVLFNDSDPEDLRKQLIPELKRDQVPAD